MKKQWEVISTKPKGNYSVKEMISILCIAGLLAMLFSWLFVYGLNIH
jgi:hypothetical protein